MTPPPQGLAGRIRDLGKRRAALGFRGDEALCKEAASALEEIAQLRNVADEYQHALFDSCGCITGYGGGHPKGDCPAPDLKETEGGTRPQDGA